MARGENPTTIRNAPTPPEGLAMPGRVLMVHPMKGYRWVLKEERVKKEKWGYGFVREYHDGDELASKSLEDMTPEELRRRADQLSQLADADEAGERPLTAKEKAYLELEERKDADEEARRKRAAEAGFQPPKQQPRRRRRRQTAAAE